jgi:hypothetical protein
MDGKRLSTFPRPDKRDACAGPRKARMKAFVMLVLTASLLMVLAPTAAAGPDTGGCAQYPTADIQVAACNGGEGDRCVLVFYGGSRAYACVPYEALVEALPLP